MKMRHIQLNVEDEELFDSILTLETFHYISKHIDAFKQMWHDQGKTFWLRFLTTYRFSFVNHGRAKIYLNDPSFPFCNKKYLHCLDGAFVYIHKAFIEGNYGEVKQLIFNLMILTKFSFLLLGVGSNSLASDPFYLKPTRECFRSLFGEPSDRKVPYFKVIFMCPVYVHFGGALYTALHRWLNKQNLPDEEINNIDKNFPYWSYPSEWTNADFFPSYYERYLSTYWKDKLPEMMILRDINKKFFVDELEEFCRCDQLSPNNQYPKESECCRCYMFNHPCPKICPICDYTADTLQAEHYFRHGKYMNNKSSSLQSNSEKIKVMSGHLTKRTKKKLRNAKCATLKDQSSKIDNFDDPFYRLKLLKMAEKKFRKENKTVEQQNCVPCSGDYAEKLCTNKNKKRNIVLGQSSSPSPDISNGTDGSKLPLQSDLDFLLNAKTDYMRCTTTSQQSTKNKKAAKQAKNTAKGYSQIKDAVYKKSDGIPKHSFASPGRHSIESIREKLDIIEKGIKETGGIGFEEFMLMLQAGEALMSSSKNKKEDIQDDISGLKKTFTKETKKLHTCANCLKKESTPKTFKKCSRCKAENMLPCYYCSKECQVEDWDERHREEHLRAN